MTTDLCARSGRAAFREKLKQNLEKTGGLHCQRKGNSTKAAGGGSGSVGGSGGGSRKRAEKTRGSPKEKVHGVLTTIVSSKATATPGAGAKTANKGGVKTVKREVSSSANGSSCTSSSSASSSSASEYGGGGVLFPNGSSFYRTNTRRQSSNTNAYRSSGHLPLLSSGLQSNANAHHRSKVRSSKVYKSGGGGRRSNGQKLNNSAGQKSNGDKLDGHDGQRSPLDGSTVSPHDRRLVEIGGAVVAAAAAARGTEGLGGVTKFGCSDRFNTRCSSRMVSFDFDNALRVPMCFDYVCV